MSTRSAHRYRARGVKREHKIVDGVLPLLEQIASLPGVASVIPGRIKPTEASVSGVRLRVQTPTLSGLKLSARSHTASQEIFVVTDTPSLVIEALQAAGLVKKQ